ncbi:erythromycin esterase family protein [Actinomadura sp. 7K507]|uniref:erythromycin esterase family protein n=1 Tax=Actinomadura sp. 7K507 TaxID=2530365 RepID=UPI00104E6235|nr:erythromycin esterase family protein [Actinomadura sp. 7K507]TDC89945.1 erythromycin esterase family protein [Actinomadura sp. 7K507]
MSDLFQPAVLGGLDPAAPLDDLEPLRDIVGDARVVALGEGCHFVREFTDARFRLLRFLAERCGFTVLAFEFGFAEGRPLGRWIRGAGGDDELSGMRGTTFAGMTGELATRLRGHNRTSEHPLDLVGIDVPEAGGTLRPALEPVAEYLREVDPDAVPFVEIALRISDEFTGASQALAAPGWGRLDRADQDALTAALARLRLRARALEPRYVAAAGQDRYDVALRDIEAACHTDYMFGAMSALFAGGGLPQDTSVRERFMSTTLRWHLDRADPDTRFVLAAHNNHIQKTPIYFDGELWAYPMGHYLARELGADYRSLALTHTAASVPEMVPDDTPGTGFSIAETPVPPPQPDSMEGALTRAGLGEDVTLTDLRPLAGGPFPARIRTQSSDLEMPVADAFDAVLCTPTATPEVTLSF